MSGRTTIKRRLDRSLLFVPQIKHAEVLSLWIEFWTIKTILYKFSVSCVLADVYSDQVFILSIVINCKVGVEAETLKHIFSDR